MDDVIFHSPPRAVSGRRSLGETPNDFWRDLDTGADGELPSPLRDGAPDAAPDLAAPFIERHAP
jgi:hypothetical protein